MPETTTTPAGLLDAAAEVIERDGWHQGNYAESNDPHAAVCSLGAINRAAGNDANTRSASGAAYDARIALAHDLGDDWQVEGCTHPAEIIAGWNDHPHRTADEVVAQLRASAARLRGERS